MSTPTVCLSIRQPWAWLILHGGKDVENRTWRTNFRGRFLIHAAKGMTRREYEEAKRFAEFVHGHKIQFPEMEELLRGGIVGEVTLEDCLPYSRSIWHEAGFWGWQLSNPKFLPFQPCRGALGLFQLPS